MKQCPQCGFVEVKKNYTEGFDVFWENYPRKVGKGAARKVWSKIKPSQVELSMMIMAIEEQKRTDSWKKDSGIYIPHPSTWLNGERWLDETQRKQEAPKFDPNKMAQKQKELEMLKERIYSMRQPSNG